MKIKIALYRSIRLPDEYAAVSTITDDDASAHENEVRISEIVEVEFPKLSTEEVARLTRAVRARKLHELQREIAELRT